MPKVQPITTNFTAGEFTPRLRGRVDLEKYNSSAELLANCVVLRHGGVTIRPSRDYKGEVKNSAQTGRPVPFVYSRTDAYILEFGNLYMRVWKNGALIGAPYEIVTPYTDAQLAALDFTQGGDTLIITHPDVYPQRLLRFADDLWTIGNAPFVPPAVYESGHRHATITMTLSDATVGAGRTLTASSAFFLASDVGRTFSCVAGVALVTGYTSTTVLTVTITRAFAGTALAATTWWLEGTPQTINTPSAKDPLGATITMTLTAAGWRADDVGKLVEMNGGLVEIAAFTSTTVVDGVIRKELLSTTASPADAWVLKGSVWNVYDGYPATCTMDQQRLWLGGTRKFPNTKWGSRPGLYFDFTPGTDDDSAVYKTLDSDEINVIQYLVSFSMLLSLTYGGEWDTKGGVEKPITQTNAQMTRRSKWGAELVRPEEAGKNLIFVEKGGTALRELFKLDIEGFDTRDISVYSEHLLRAGVKSIAWEKKPEQVLWVATTDGKLLAVTYSDEQKLVAFCSGDAEGIVEWVATIPEGALDATYCLTRYTINGVTKRYIERINWTAPPGQDCRKERTGAASLTWNGYDHLEGKNVPVLADDVYVGNKTVTGGIITLPRTAVKVSAGLGYAARVRLAAPEVGTGTGTSQGQAMTTDKVWVRFLNTIGCKLGDQVIAFRHFGEDVLDQPPTAFSGIKEITDYGWENGDSIKELVQDQPYPWTILSVIRNLSVNTG